MFVFISCLFENLRVIVFFVCLWLNDIPKLKIVQPNASNTLGVVQALGVSKCLSPSPTVNQSEKFHDNIYYCIFNVQIINFPFLFLRISIFSPEVKSSESPRLINF